MDLRARYDQINQKFLDSFGEPLPLMQLDFVLNDEKALDELEANVYECIKQGKDLLDKMYGWDYESGIIYA